MCPICMRFSESAIHALWECEAAKDVWFGSLKILQKRVSSLVDMIHLMKYLLDQVEPQDMEVVLVRMVDLESKKLGYAWRKVS